MFVLAWVGPESGLSRVWVRPESGLSRAWVGPESGLSLCYSRFSWKWGYGFMVLVVYLLCRWGGDTRHPLDRIRHCLVQRIVLTVSKICFESGSNHFLIRSKGQGKNRIRHIWYRGSIPPVFIISLAFLCAVDILIQDLMWSQYQKSWLILTPWPLDPLLVPQVKYS